MCSRRCRRPPSQLLRDQIVSLTQTPSRALSFSLVVSILLALWSASSGTSSLMTGINIAYDEQESRNFLKLRGTALLLTLGAIVFVLLTLALVAVVPAVLNALQLGTLINVIVQVVRWFLLVVLVVVALAVVYRLGARPRRSQAQVDQRRRRGLRRALGARPASASASTSTTSAATTRPTARWPASSSCCCGCT